MQSLKNLKLYKWSYKQKTFKSHLNIALLHLHSTDCEVRWANKVPQVWNIMKECTATLNSLSGGSNRSH